MAVPPQVAPAPVIRRPKEWWGRRSSDVSLNGVEYHNNWMDYWSIRDNPDHARVVARLGKNPVDHAAGPVALPRIPWEEQKKRSTWQEPRLQRVASTPVGPSDGISHAASVATERGQARAAPGSRGSHGGGSAVATVASPSSSGRRRRSATSASGVRNDGRRSGHG
mmetsp:Transcript_87769/g.246621  ORF Transcript_87769/g.246621 Transcript_87769/m.246621 type:complete len:166 (-) Transcript_87769:155-652(-)